VQGKEASLGDPSTCDAQEANLRFCLTRQKKTCLREINDFVWDFLRWIIHIFGWAELHLRPELSIGVHSPMTDLSIGGHIDLFKPSHEGMIYLSKYLQMADDISLTLSPRMKRRYLWLGLSIQAFG
jgi:hypothetical protein